MLLNRWAEAWVEQHITNKIKKRCTENIVASYGRLILKLR
jgi:hypothetical protein